MSKVYCFEHYTDPFDDFFTPYYFTLPKGLSFQTFQARFDKIVQEYRDKESEIQNVRQNQLKIVNEEIKKRSGSLLKGDLFPETDAYKCALAGSVMNEKLLDKLHEKYSFDKIVEMAGGTELTVTSENVHLNY